MSRPTVSLTSGGSSVEGSLTAATTSVSHPSQCRSARPHPVTIAAHTKATHPTAYRQPVTSGSHGRRGSGALNYSCNESCQGIMDHSRTAADSFRCNSINQDVDET